MFYTLIKELKIWSSTARVKGSLYDINTKFWISVVVCYGDAWISIVKVVDIVGNAYWICTVVNNYSHTRFEAFTVTECSAVFKKVSCVSVKCIPNFEDYFCIYYWAVMKWVWVTQLFVVCVNNLLVSTVG